jgi:hypothetical protein
MRVLPSFGRVDPPPAVAQQIHHESKHVRPPTMGPIRYGSQSAKAAAHPHRPMVATTSRGPRSLAGFSEALCRASTNGNESC